jgi:hypothetical protein
MFERFPLKFGGLFLVSNPGIAPGYVLARGPEGWSFFGPIALLPRSGTLDMLVLNPELYDQILADVEAVKR